MATTTVKPVPMTTINSSALNPSTYTAINPNGLPNACFLLRITNASTNGVFISWDGVTDADSINTLGVLELNAQTNAQPNARECLVPVGTVFWAKGTAGTGLITVAGYYQ